MASNGMLDIETKRLLLEQVSELQQINQNIRSAIENLQACSSEISAAWNSDTEDKTSYLSSMDKNLEKASSLVQAVLSITNYLQTYAQRVIATESQTIN